MMKLLKKYWKVLVALVLLAAAVYLYFEVYETEKMAYESEVRQLNTIIDAMEESILENRRYAGVQKDLEIATAEVNASRLKLYQHFPLAMLEEDQIMYVLYLETIFGTEINFEFSHAEPVMTRPLADGAYLMGLKLTVNYETTYEGFQKMINYLATDSRITSVHMATIQYDAEHDIATGTVTVQLYLMLSDKLEYLPPDVAEPETGKENIFE